MLLLSLLMVPRYLGSKSSNSLSNGNETILVSRDERTDRRMDGRAEEAGEGMDLVGAIKVASEQVAIVIKVAK